MREAAKQFEFEKAAQLRDRIKGLREKCRLERARGRRMQEKVKRQIQEVEGVALRGEAAKQSRTALT